MKIYAIRKQPNMQLIRQIATKLRSMLVSDDEETLKSLCLPVSRHLAQLLINKGFAAANVVRGTFTVDNPDPSACAELDVKDFLGDSLDEEEAMAQAYDEMNDAMFHPVHYWVQIGGLIIDITADQFNDEINDPYPPVMIDNIENVSDRYDIVAEDFIEPRIMYPNAVF